VVSDYIKAVINGEMMEVNNVEVDISDEVRKTTAELVINLVHTSLQVLFDNILDDNNTLNPKLIYVIVWKIAVKMLGTRYTKQKNERTHRQMNLDGYKNKKKVRITENEMEERAGTHEKQVLNKGIMKKQNKQTMFQLETMKYKHRFDFFFQVQVDAKKWKEATTKIANKIKE
jgi:hypothetical protein